MKKIFATVACLLSFQAYAVEAEVQFENDQVCVLNMKVMAHEEIGLHRNQYPQVVISLKGGTLTRLEADGSRSEVHFPKAEAVFLEADAPDELHNSINNTCKLVELIIIQLKTPPVTN